MSTQQQDPYWNARATEIQQLNPGGTDQRQSIELQPTVLKVFRDWVNHQACTLSHNIYVVSSSFITNDVLTDHKSLSAKNIF